MGCKVFLPISSLYTFTHWQTSHYLIISVTHLKMFGKYQLPLPSPSFCPYQSDQGRTLDFCDEPIPWWKAFIISCHHTMSATTCMSFTVKIIKEIETNELNILAKSKSSIATCLLQICVYITNAVTSEISIKCQNFNGILMLKWYYKLLLYSQNHYNNKDTNNFKWWRILCTFTAWKFKFNMTCKGSKLKCTCLNNTWKKKNIM